MPIAKSLLTVVETEPYLADARRILGDEERSAVVDMVAHDPECGVVLRGTGGIRKVRFGYGGRGKSGGVRVIYYYRNMEMPLFLLAIFAKNERDNLSQAERNALAKLGRVLAESYGDHR